jgi:malate dehydrogenase
MFASAILGAGPIGRAVAQRLAERGRFRHVVLIDDAASAAEGVALDVQQSGPVLGFETRLTATVDVLAAASADVIVIADRWDGVEWHGTDGLALLARLVRSGATAPLVFAGPAQHALMEAAYLELAVPGDRLVGTAPSALAASIQTLVGLELGVSSVNLVVAGRPPAFVVGWSAAAVSGTLIRDRLPAHRLLAISQALPRLWPAGSYAIGSATARIVEALCLGSRERLSALTVLDGELGVRGAAIMLPLEIGHGRVRGHLMPSLSEQEWTALLNGLTRSLNSPEAPAPGRSSRGSS